MISRRDFLKIAGVTALSTQFTSWGFSIASAEMPLQGRILRSLPQDGLLPDSVHEILDYQDGWVQLAAGKAQENVIQPMFTAHHRLPVELPAYVEVTAPYAALRGYCTADAPLVARPGHGAVFKAVKKLLDQHGQFDWYQVELGNQQTAWVQGKHIQAFRMDAPIPETYGIIEHHSLRIFREDAEIARFSLACPSDLPTGVHEIIRRDVYGHTLNHAGVPYILETHRGVKLGGVYWHNQFGCTSQSAQIELSVLAAKSVFALLGEGSTVTVL